MHELWCAAQDLDWAESLVRVCAGDERKLMQTGRDRRTRNVSFCKSRRCFLCNITDLIDGNASARIRTKFGPRSARRAEAAPCRAETTRSPCLTPSPPPPAAAHARAYLNASVQESGALPQPHPHPPTPPPTHTFTQNMSLAERGGLTPPLGGVWQTAVPIRYESTLRQIHLSFRLA